MDNASKKCGICGKTVSSDNKLQESYLGDYIDMCTICRGHINTIKSEGNTEGISASINYFSSEISCKNKLVCEALYKLIMKYAGSHISNKEEFKQKYETINNMQINIQSIDTKQNNISTQNKSSFWITGMKVFAWIMFFGISIGGISAGAILGDGEPILIFGCFIGSIILAFLSVAVIMIFLGMATDIKATRHSIEILSSSVKNKKTTNNNPENNQ